MLTGTKRERDNGEIVKGITNDDLVRLLELKRQRENLTAQLHSIEQEITSLEQQKEKAILARNNAVHNSQLQGMEPFLEKLLDIDGHMAQISTYTRELKDRVTHLEEKLSVKTPAIPGIPVENVKKENKLNNSVRSNSESSKDKLWLMTTLQKRCTELDSYNRDLNHLRMIVDLANKDLTDYKNLKHILTNKH